MISVPEREALWQRLCDVIPQLWAEGYRTFLSGGALGFDTLAAQAVLFCRPSCPGIRLKMVLPCRSQSGAWSAEDRQIYEQVLRSADEVICLSETYYQGCMLMRNRYLVAHASQCVCFYKDRKGGTSFTVALAWREGLSIRNLAVPEREL